MENVLNVAFEGKKVAYAEGLTQWDKGWTLKVTGIEDITDSVEVHFSLDEAGGKAKRALATVENGILTVGVANFILEAADIINYNAYAFIYTITADKAKTERKIVFAIKARPKPEDYVKPEEPGLIETLIEQVGKKADKATTLKGYGIEDAYTKEEADGKLKAKVDKVEGKGLSTNDYTDADKRKLNSLPTEAENDKKYAAKATTLKGYGIEDAYTKEETDKKEKTANNIYANALKATASGEVIKVGDVSTIEHTVKLKIKGKNLLPTSLAEGHFALDGDFIHDSDYRSTNMFLNKGVYTLTAPSNITLMRKKTNGKVEAIIHPFANGKYSFELAENSDVGFSFRLEPKGGWDDTIKMQLEQGDTATEYEPYIDPTTVTVTRYGEDETDRPQTYIPEADGTVNIESVAPTMTLLTDTAGVNIEAEYNQDANAAKKNIEADISELDRVQGEIIEDIGDIETALDSIITMQSELIGGASV